MAQEALLGLTGNEPLSFSFPHGLYSETAIKAVAAAGPRFAANVDYRINSTGRAERLDGMMRISRMPIFGDRSISAQFAASSARVSAGRALAVTAKYVATLRRGSAPRSGALRSC
jgi:hypothetical protein